MAVNICILGGDNRFHFVKAYLKEILKLKEIEGNINSSLCHTDYFVLPIPYHRKQIITGTKQRRDILNDLFALLKKNTTLFIGKTDNFIEKIAKDFNVIDYSVDGWYVDRNAELTALGALQNLKKAKLINKQSKILIIGWGRIGKYLCQTFQKEGNDDITILSTNVSKREDIERNQASVLSETDSIDYFDIILNTAPAEVLTMQQFEHIKKGQIIIELASGIGGFKAEYRSKYKLTVLDYMGIPGKNFPKEAGEILAKTILNHIQTKEEIKGGVIQWISQI